MALARVDTQPASGPRWGFGAFLLVEAVLLLTAVFVSVLLGAPGSGENVPIDHVLIGTVTPTVIAAGLAVAITVVRGNGPLFDLRLSLRWDDVRTGLRFGLLGLAVTVAGVAVWNGVVDQDDAQSAIGGLVSDQPLSVYAALAVFFYLWLIGPICEEIIFRGLLWSAVERLQWRTEQWGRVAAFVLSTALFAVSHLEPIRTSLLLVIAVPIGLARLRTGRLLASIVAHQVNNFLPALAILLAATGMLDT